MLSVVDAYARECLAPEADSSFANRRVTRVLDEIIKRRVEPRSIPFAALRRVILEIPTWTKVNAHAAFVPKRSSKSLRPRSCARLSANKAHFLPAHERDKQRTVKIPPPEPARFMH